MSSSFEADKFPGRPRILFIGLAESSHTHSWIDLLEDAQLNVRLFALPSGVPPDNWPVRTYVTAYYGGPLDAATRARLYPESRAARYAWRNAARLFGASSVDELATRWLGRIIRGWRPHVVHTLGLEPAAYFYFQARGRFGFEGAGRWVAQVRGGPELALHRLLPEEAARIREVLAACDFLVADNAQNYEFALEMGLKTEQLARVGVVPGTGGIDVEALASRWEGPPSSRRVVLWPKAYECPQGKALPVFEALKLAWERLPPFEWQVLAITPETRMWFETLPAGIRSRCHVAERAPRRHVLELMTKARVMLAPSLADGVPNALYEAMAAGAFPIVSPLDTIRPVVEPERNVLFARNLYPHELAEALVRALTDDALVDRAAERNLELVRRIADRAAIRPRVVEFYEELAGQKG